MIRKAKKFVIDSIKVAFMGVYIALAFVFSMAWIAFVVCLTALPLALLILVITWAVNCILK